MLKKLTYTALLAGLILPLSFNLTAYASGAAGGNTYNSDAAVVTIDASAGSFFRIAVDVPSSSIPDEDNDDTDNDDTDNDIPSNGGAGNILFENGHHTGNHGTRITPIGGADDGVIVTVASNQNFVLAVEAAGDFIDPANPDAVIPLTHLRTRVANRFFNDITILPNNVINRETIGIYNSSHSFFALEKTPREIIHNTTARGDNIQYEMWFDFLVDRYLPVGEFETTIRYTAWQN